MIINDNDKDEGENGKKDDQSQSPHPLRSLGVLQLIAISFFAVSGGMKQSLSSFHF